MNPVSKRPSSMTKKTMLAFLCAAMLFLSVTSLGRSAQARPSGPSLGQTPPQSPPEGSKPNQDRFAVPDVTAPKTERMVDVGGRKLHARLYGQGSPTVVFITGTGNAPQETWNPLIDSLAAEATLITYDRAGIGKSEIGDLPTHAKQSAVDLRRLLKEFNVPKPVLLVGHSYGVRVVKLFASLFPDEVGGLVLMDGTPPTILEAKKKILSGADLERLEKMTSGATAPPSPRTEMDYSLVSLEQERQMGPLPHMPTLVLIAGANREAGVPPGFSPEARRKMAQLGLDLQKKMAADLGGEFIVFDDLSHYMHLEKPAPVIQAIKGMIQKLRVGFPTLNGPYLGQKRPGAMPEIFAPGILSLGFHEHNIAISPDGQEIFFVAASSDFSRYLILTTRLRNGAWTMPKIAPFSGPGIDQAPAFSPDGKRLYFTSRRPRAAGGTPAQDFDIWSVERQNDAWTDPKNLGSPVNSGQNEANPSVASDGTIYFQRIEKLGTLSWDLYMSSPKKGIYGLPEKLPAPVNTEANEAGPFIAPDGSYLLFQSNRPGGYGVMDIYITYRTKDGGWSDPVNLGEKINSLYSDWGPVVSPDGKYLFFGSFRNIHPTKPESPSYFEYLKFRLGEPSPGKGTLYWVEATALDVLKPK